MKENKINNKSKVKITLDDKGRRKFDFSEFEFNKEEENKQNEENDEFKLYLNEIAKFKFQNKYIDNQQVLDNINSSLNKKHSEFKANNNTSVYFCSICNIEMKDSNGYMEHLHGRLHNSKLGVNLKVKKVGLDDVKELFIKLKKKSNIDLIRDKLLSSKRFSENIDN